MRLPPFIMTPAFRCGADTPWGGDSLKTVFNKPILDARTGESLEVSVIDGLNSLDARGVPLGDLLVQYGEALSGTAVRGAFPLLLKLIDARDTLSVQVHPNDAYAAMREGKLGKTEAWVILRAEPDASIVYGVRRGVSKEELREAAVTGKGMEDLLRFQPVRAGDVFYIPAGMVHAIGGGILLYEIQQSSDVTYRFYDWNRTDAQGRKRALSIDRALDATNPDYYMLGKAVGRVLDDPTCRREQILDTRYFSLQRLTVCRETPFLSDGRAFSILTALEAGELRLEDGSAIALNPGQTALLPAQCEAFKLSGEAFLLAAPGV